MTISIKKKKILSQLLILSIGIIVGGIISHLNSRCVDSTFTYINHDLSCNTKIIVEKNSYATLKNKLEDYIALQNKDKVVTDVAVYFRDLQNGPTMGLNEYELFSPASLLKLPLLLSFYELQSEDNSNLFNEKITIPEDEQVFVQNIMPAEYAKPGSTYRVDELLKYMIVYSDNNSYYALRDYLHTISPQRDLLKDTFVDLGIVDPKDDLDNTISVKSYGSIFIQLYNSSYFNTKDVSEKILNLLSHVDYTDGLVAGVPTGVKVSHKFGERSNIDGNLDQLHDCGIVYYPGNPYLLCIMTRGNDFNQLSRVIRSISKMVYDEFDSRKI